jgi:ABC-type branched-subunit amino acid transport system ATPase component
VTEETATPSTPALSARGLRKAFGAVQAVDGVSFDLMPGTATGLIGPNGSGKSTLIEMLSGLLPQDEGKVLINDRDISRWSPHRRAKAGLTRTFQVSRLWPALSCAENLLAAAPDAGRDQLWRSFFAPRSLREVEKQDRATAAEILNDFDMWRLRNEPATSLSGGQARLLEFGRILMSKATVALLDEPLAGVNPVMADAVIAGVRRLQNAGITVLLVEHNLGVIQSLCPYVIGMESGRIAATPYR